VAGTIELGRTAFTSQAWAEAYTLLVTADPAQVEDLERLAVAAYLVGRDEVSARAWERAHRACVAGGDRDRAARCAFWLAFGLLLRGDVARARGWLARAERLVENLGGESVAGGFLQVPVLLEALEGRSGRTKCPARSSPWPGATTTLTCWRSACWAAARRRWRSARPSGACTCSTR
jgi:hypothetical protein